jgi:hypothetical protein
MLIYLAITNQLPRPFYRFLILSLAACVFTQSLTIIYVTPHSRRNLFHSQRKKKIYLTIKISSQPKTNKIHSISSHNSEHTFKLNSFTSKY